MHPTLQKEFNLSTSCLFLETWILTSNYFFFFSPFFGNEIGIWTWIANRFCVFYIKPSAEGQTKAALCVGG